ncbi:MAG: hypothetical protein A2289_03955 [Deltaproteobacteria bacterium RIFOXYA12_FULL_58_15]|nr:MAG: hypothetical protein A2289_03955 [Deltaproteobacteria bacterium RIFOXYA12_FULL_58_15]OGR11497.1 MAG: hypothetical protein A2341_28385 [Deltaproteobacteria bacterium RIFOXYB12_FULL_58_9]
MTIKQWIRSLFLLVALAAGLEGCALLRSGGSSGSMTPDWVQRGSTLVVDGDKRYFTGVGAAYDKLRPPLLKKIAQKKALAAINEPIKEYLKALAAPWFKSLDKETAELIKPDTILDGLLKRCTGLAAIDEVYVASDNGSTFALSRVDYMAVRMEIEATPSAEPLRLFVTNAGIDPDALFNQVATRVAQAKGKSQKEPSADGTKAAPTKPGGGSQED